VGFAAETDHVAEHARAKLESKHADLIVANDVTSEGAGFDHDTNIITLYSRDGGEKAFPRMPKIDAAHQILDRMLELRRAGREMPATQRAR
jgi:phosphopantothenoylcysteine decarboxylase/phosphopantothenate--cysteine ligase